MKFPLLALLCASAAALGQLSGPEMADPDNLFEMPKKFIEPAQPGFGTFEPLPPMKNDLVLAFPTIMTTRPMLNSPQIDPKIIVHPPWHGASKGKDVSRRMYPDLKFLPLHRGSIPR